MDITLGSFSFTTISKLSEHMFNLFTIAISLLVVWFSSLSFKKCI